MNSYKRMLPAQSGYVCLCSERKSGQKIEHPLLTLPNPNDSSIAVFYDLVTLPALGCQVIFALTNSTHGANVKMCLQTFNMKIFIDIF